jgi:hypothetical protein
MEANQYGLAYYDGKWRYFEKYKPVKKGKKRGSYWIFLRGKGKRLVRPESIKRLPSPPGQLRLFN